MASSHVTKPVLLNHCWAAALSLFPSLSDILQRLPTQAPLTLPTPQGCALPALFLLLLGCSSPIPSELQTHGHWPPRGACRLRLPPKSTQCLHQGSPPPGCLPWPEAPGAPPVCEPGSWRLSFPTWSLQFPLSPDSLPHGPSSPFLLWPQLRASLSIVLVAAAAPRLSVSSSTQPSHSCPGRPLGKPLAPQLSAEGPP